MTKSKRQSYVVVWKNSQNNKYKIVNRKDLTILLLSLDELIKFNKSKFNDIKLERFMDNIDIKSDPIKNIILEYLN